MKQLSRTKGILFFYGFDIILLLILIISFLPSIHSRRNVYESAVLNPKYIDDVSDVKISIPELGTMYNIHLFKKSGIWMGTSSSYKISSSIDMSTAEESESKAGGDTGSEAVIWPCDIQSVENLIKVAGKTVKMYKKSDSRDSWDNLNVDEENGRCVIFSGEDGEVYSKLYYGIEDPITQSIAVRSIAGDIVYDTESDIKTYLNSDVSFWADPFIYPQCVTEMERSQAENLLRRGKVTGSEFVKDKTPVSIYKKLFDNECQIILNVYENDGVSYIVVPEFKAGVNDGDDKTDALNCFNYCYSISKWTYSNLDGEISEN